MFVEVLLCICAQLQTDINAYKPKQADIAAIVVFGSALTLCDFSFNLHQKDDPLLGGFRVLCNPLVLRHGPKTAAWTMPSCTSV